MMRLCLALAVVLGLSHAALTTWLVQNVYRSAVNCDPVSLAAATSWATGACLKWNTTHYNVKYCNRTHVTTHFCDDAACEQCPQRTSYPASACGSITTPDGGQSIFFGCIAAPEPPTLSPVTNNVMNEFTYFGSNCSSPSVGPSSVYQAISRFSGWCLAGEKVTCKADPPSASFQTPCTGGIPVAASLNVCGDASLEGVPFAKKNQCQDATEPTAPPTDPDAPPTPPSEDSVTACENAKTYEECILGVPTSNGKPTLPPSGLLNRCCVWCSGTNSSSGQGSSCRTPPFNKELCSCNIEGTANFTDLVKGYGCPADNTVKVDCKCTGKPLGAPYCVGASGLSALAALVIVFLSSVMFL